MMGAMASQIISITIVYSTVYSGADHRKHQSSAPLAFVRGINPSPVNSPTNGQSRGKCFHLMTSSCEYICAPKTASPCRPNTMIPTTTIVSVNFFLISKLFISMNWFTGYHTDDSHNANIPQWKFIKWFIHYNQIDKCWQWCKNTHIAK